MRRTIAIKIFTTCLLAFSGCAITGYSPGTAEQSRARDLVDQGTWFLRNGKLNEAQASFEVAAEVFPNAAAWDGMGCVAFLRKDFENAEKLFRRAYDMDINYNHALINLALLYEVTRNRAQAEEMYRRAIADNPSDFRVRNNYAVFLAEGASGSRDRGRIESVRKELLRSKALADHPLISNNLEIVNEVR